MIDIQRAMKNDRMMRSLTGLDKKKFLALLPTFERIEKERTIERVKSDPKRRRGPGAGKKHTLATSEDKLFFILFYIKVYPTFDLAGFLYGVDRSQTNRWFHSFLPILEKTLKRECTLPERKIASVEEFWRKFPGVKDLFIDATEREIQRPKDPKRERKYYSGKKKRHTLKNTIVADETRRVLIVTRTTRGSRHDKRVYDKEELHRQIPPEVTQWVDTGYQGIERVSSNVMMPKKRTKHRPLTDKEKEENRLISSIRIVAEHAIGGIKRLGALRQPYRNRKAFVEDRLMLVGAGIWNHHLSTAY